MRGLGDIAIAYCVGIAAPAAFFSIPYFMTPFPAFFGVGFLFGLPVLAVTVAVFLLFRTHIYRHPNLWCGLAPFLAVLIFLTLDVVVFGVGNLSLAGIGSMISSQLVIYAVLTFICALVAAVVFRIRIFRAQQPVLITMVGE